ncbi:hypothetical protein CYMTET_14549 [Cymbomonas tetramitiformis]|uniref:ABC1 atypical kinase-like domain-containing protein n=1 Tax=Cymbomonas tetramitiformis TaxID=36881 RepID=A0AAE0LA93_9CHLO|nr:hypothetical protein CYMTET_14549 [Cymbomonas tetramitiformis]
MGLRLQPGALSRRVIRWRSSSAGGATPSGNASGDSILTRASALGGRILARGFLGATAATGGALAFMYAVPPPNDDTAQDKVYLVQPKEQKGLLLEGSLLLRIREALWIGARTMWLLTIFLPLFFITPLAFYWDDSGKWRERWASLLLHTLETAGPAFMKWGQWAAARPDLLPTDICSKLESLHQEAPVHSFAYTKTILENAFGAPLEKLFDEFDPVPLASGTIGQVHRAVISPGCTSLVCGADAEEQLVKERTLVAVKVRHPSVESSIRHDFAILKGITHVLNMMPSLEWLHLNELTWQFETMLAAQVDLTTEGLKLEAFNYNFRLWNFVAFPKPIFAHPAALVETFEEGVTIQKYLKEAAKVANTEGVTALNEFNQILAKLGLSLMMKMMLWDNLVHADLHPGNVLVREPPSNLATGSPIVAMLGRLAGFKWQSCPQIVLLDAGMTADLESSDSGNLLDFFQAVSTFDGPNLARTMMHFSVDKDDDAKQAAFASVMPDFVGEISDLMAYFKGRSDDKMWVNFNLCLEGILQTVRSYHLCIQGSVCTIIVTSMMLAQMQDSLDSDCHVMQVLDKFLLLKEVGRLGSENWAKWMDYLIAIDSVITWSESSFKPDTKRHLYTILQGNRSA